MSEPVTNSVAALIASTGAAMRVADTLLRAAGGRQVLLRLPAPAVPADPAEQLGLATPEFQDVPLGPAVFRKARATGSAGGAPPRWELLVSGTAVAMQTGPLAYGSAEALFASAVGVIVDAVWFDLIEAAESQAFGQAYVYRLLVRERTADAL